MAKTLEIVLTAGLSVLVLFVSGCATGRYTPPTKNSDSMKYTMTVHQGFDETWSAMIDYSASTFFSIENFEKDSGLLTLSFGASNLQEYIDCGEYEATLGRAHYNGSYVGFLEKYYDAKLNGKMNILVKEVDPNNTMVRVNARYIFSYSSLPNMTMVFEPGPSTWSFDSGSSTTVSVRKPVGGTSPDRTCAPTYKAEKAILRATENMK